MGENHSSLYWQGALLQTDYRTGGCFEKGRQWWTRAALRTTIPSFDSKRSGLEVEVGLCRLCSLGWGGGVTRPPGVTAVWVLGNKIGQPHSRKEYQQKKTGGEENLMKVRLGKKKRSKTEREGPSHHTWLGHKAVLNNIIQQYNQAHFSSHRTVQNRSLCECHGHSSPRDARLGNHVKASDGPYHGKVDGACLKEKRQDYRVTRQWGTV